MATKPPINRTQIELQAKFAEIIDRLLLLMQGEGWTRVERDGVAPYTAKLQDKAHIVHLELTLKPRSGGKASISCLFTTPTMYSSARAIASLKLIQMQAPVDTVAGRILTGYAEAMPGIDEGIADFVRSVKDAGAETKTLQEVWQMLGGDKPSYVSFKRIDTYGVPDVRIERQGTNSLHMTLDKLTNHQVLEIAKLLADNESLPPLPHPSETLKVDDLGIVYCVDAMVGKDLETGRKRVYKIVWKLEADEWDALANINDEDVIILTKCGTTFPSEDDFAEAAAHLERHLGIRIGDGEE